MISSNDIMPLFSRGEVAKILRVVPITIANRETKGIYPTPTRDLNQRRIYTIEDILLLQVISFGKIEPSSIMTLLHDKGYKNPKEAAALIDNAIKKITK